jgi:ABC-type dipeptide/oligopeptide/nickel transport system ATPase subunit
LGICDLDLDKNEKSNKKLDKKKVKRVKISLLEGKMLGITGRSLFADVEIKAVIIDLQKKNVNDEIYRTVKWLCETVCALIYFLISVYFEIFEIKKKREER